MTTPDKANEAGPEATEAGLWATAHPAHGELGRPDLAHQRVAILAQDSKAARILAKAEAVRVKAEASALAQDAEAERSHRAELAHLQAQAAKAARKQARADARSARRAEARRKAGSKAAGALAYVRSEAAASYSAFIYLVAVTVAVGSQVVFFRGLIETSPALSLVRSFSLVAALVAALFVEGFGLAFYATSVSSRLKGRSGWVARVAAWGVTAGAAALQYQAHRDLVVNGHPLLSYACAGASAGAMLLAEVRTTHLVGERLEALDQKDRPQPRIGVKFCLRYPKQAWWALSAMIASPNVRTRTKALRAGRRMAYLSERAKLSEYLMREAERALGAAQKRGDASEAVLFRLQELAYLGLDALGRQVELASVAAEAPEASASAAQSAASTTEAEAVDFEGGDEGRPSEDEADTEDPFEVEEPASDDEAAVSGPAHKDQPDPEAKPQRPSFAQWAEANGWARRPGGLQAWTERIAYLAACYPAKDDANLGVPSRATIIEDMRALALDPEESKRPRQAWSNKEHVGYAMNDLRHLRMEGYLDPVLCPDPSTLSS